MIAKCYGHSYSLQTLREKAFITREGVSMLEISDAAESIGFRNQNHFMVLYKIKKDGFYIAGPASKRIIFTDFFDWKINISVKNVLHFCYSKKNTIFSALRKNTQIMKYVVGIIVLIGILSCSNKRTENFCYSVDKLRNSHEKFFSLENIDYDISYILLEFNEYCPIGVIENLVMTQEHIFIRSDDNLYKFDRTGRFIKRIGSKGQGVGEHNTILDFAVNEVANRILIADLNQHVLSYDLDGQYIGRFHVESLPFHLASLDNYVLFRTMNITGQEENKLIVTTLNGDSVTSSSNGILYSNPGFSLYYSLKSFQKYDDELIFHQLFNDTVYTFNPHNQTLIPRYCFDFANEKLPIDELGQNKQLSQYAYLDYITETPDYIYVTIAYKGKSENYIICKNSGNIFQPDDKQKGIYIKDTGRYFWPLWTTGIDKLISYYSADFLLEYKEQFLDSRLNTVISKISEDSNPVIVLVKIKR
jgi:hypothetical protein